MRRGLRACGLLALLLACPACRERDPTPGEVPGSWHVGSAPYDLALGDLDGDGKTDALVGCLLDEGVTLLMGGPMERPRRRLDLALGGPVPAVAIAGRGDSMAAAVRSRTGALALLGLDASGRLRLERTVALPDLPNDVAWLPANPGLPGRWAVALEGGKIGLLPAQPALDHTPGGTAMTFRVACPGESHGPDGLTTADLDGDGAAELLAACYDSWSVVTLPAATDELDGEDLPAGRRLAAIPAEQVREAAARLAPQRAAGAPLGGLRKPQAGDLDGDGQSDVVAVGDWGLVLIIEAAARPEPRARILETDFDGSNTVALGDVTGDGRSDLVLTSGHERQLLVVDLFDPENPGGYRMRRTGVLPDTPESVMLHDLDGDGLLDAVVVAERDHTLQYLRGLGDGLFRPLGSGSWTGRSAARPAGGKP